MTNLFKKTVFPLIFTAFCFSNLNAQMVNVTLEARNVLGDGTGYQLLLDATATQYGVAFPIKNMIMWDSCNIPANLYDVFSAKIPASATPECNSTGQIINQKLTIQIPAGIYDWCIVSPIRDSYYMGSFYPGGIYMAGGNGEYATIRDNYLFEEGKDYHFHVKVVGDPMLSLFSDDGVEITITEKLKRCPAITNLTSSTFCGNKAKLTWTAPSGKAFVNYKIYQENKEIDVVTSGKTEWISNSLTTGTYNFSVAAVYETTDECLPVRITTNPVIIKTCDIEEIASNLTVEYNTECSKAEIKWDAPAKPAKTAKTKNDEENNEIYNNGPFITHTEEGADGTDVSETNAPRSASNGWPANLTAGFMVADDFILDDDYTVETIDFFAFQNGAGIESTITGVYVQIYEGSPMKGGKLIWGNTTTNRMLSTSYTNVNRVSIYDHLDITRRIMKVTAKIETELFAGINYWLVWGFTGSPSLGSPQQVPVTVSGQRETGNSIYKENSEWKIAADMYTQAIHDFPFNIYGKKYVNEDETIKYNVYRNGAKIAGPIEETSYEDNTFNKYQQHTWSVAVACINGGGGEEISLKIDACAPNSIHEIENNVSIYPNPTSGTVTIKMEKLLKYEIYNAFGQLIETGNNNTVNLSSYSAGIYIFKLFDFDNNIITKRIAKTN